MSRLRAWTWKEAREHRWALLGVWLAVGLITAVPFVVLREETTRTGLDELPGVAIALATLVLGLDLFARETRRSTHALILRTPGAMRWAFPAKLLVLALGTLGALAIEELLRHPLEAVTGIPRSYRISFFEGEWRRFDRPIQPETEFGIPTAIYLGCLAAAVGVWHVAGSVVSPRAGVGALCGVLALGVLSVPFFLLYAQHPWWFRPSSGEAYAWIAAIGGAGLLVAAVGWYSGRRFLLPRKTAALRGGVTAVVLAGLATGAAAYAIDRWEAADPRAPEFRIESGFLGAGGKRLYLTTSRGSMYGDFSQTTRQTPPLAWTVALDDPTERESRVQKGAWFREPPGIARTRALVPLPFVVRVDQDLPRAGTWSDRWTWIDATTNETRFVGGPNSLGPATIEAARATAKAQTPLRDSKGRRVWWVEGAVERDGDEKRVVATPLSTWREDRVPRLLPAGFLVEGQARDPHRPDSYPTYTRMKIDAESGEATQQPLLENIAPPDFRERAKGVGLGGTWIDLGDSKYLIRRTARTDTGLLDTGWLLWDATKPDRFEPAPGAPASWYIQVVAEGTLLIVEDAGAAPAVGPATKPRLVLWKPLTGQQAPVIGTDASLLTPGSTGLLGVLPDGRHFVRLYERGERPLGRHALVLLDVAARTITPVAPWSAGGWEPIAFDVDGSLLVIEGSRRVVRLSDEGRKRELVWPK